MLDAVNAASVGGAGATVHVAAESVHGASEPNDLSRWARVRAKRSPEWTDRTLGAHAGSTVGCVRRLGSGGVGARAGRANGRFAFARAYGLQGHRAPDRQADSARARGPRRVSRRLHIARAYRLPGSRPR